MVIFNFDVGQMMKIVNIAGKRTLKLVKKNGQVWELSSVEN